MNAFICNSPMQIMRAIQLKTSVDYFEEDADIFISDIFNGAIMVADNLRKQKIFQTVILVNQRELDSKKLLTIFYGNNYILQKFSFHSYQKLIAFNVSAKQIDILYNLNKFNEEFEYHCVEDAPNTCLIPEYSQNRWYHPNKFVGLEQPCYHISKWWTSCPELISIPEVYHTTKEKLPTINIFDEYLVRLINETFGYIKDKDLEEADVLIMDESHYQDGLMIDNADFKLYKKIKDRYKNAKLLVKMHPRTKDNRFEAEFKILKNSYIPWEVYALNRAKNKSKDLLQISICCTTMVSDKLLFDYEGTKIFMAPLFYDKIRTGNDNAPRVCLDSTARIEKIRDTYHDKNQFIIVDSEDALFTILNQKLSK